MTEENFPRVSSEEPIVASEPSTSKPRRKRKWDQPDESLFSGGVLSGMLPMGTLGCAMVALPGAVSASSALSTYPPTPGYVNMSKEIQAPFMQATAVVQKLIQPKIQEDLIVAREIVINDADPAIRYKLTKRQTQEEIQKCTGSVVITRGKYRPPNAVPDGEKPLYLHISAGAHLKETAERILAVDRAAAMVEEMLKQVSHPLSTCVYLGFDANPSSNIASRIRGPNDQYINHIMNETGATVILRGRGSGYLVSDQGEEGQQPMHLLLSSNNHKALEDARLLAENLLDTISRECGATRVPSCKVYSAVPPPQQLLIGVQSSGTELTSNLSSAASLACLPATSEPGAPVPSVVAPMVTTAFPYGQVAQTGGLLPAYHSQTNGFPYSQPSLTGSTSYNGYAGIYPQATPLQQVALALRHSSPVTSTVAPAASVPTSSVVSKSSLETEKQPQQKRKFQEAPVLVGVAVPLQGSGVTDAHKCSSSVQEKKGTSPLPAKKVDSPSNGTVPTSLKSMLPPPPPRNSSLMPPPRSMPSTPPPPKFSSPVHYSRASDNDNISSKSTPIVPDTLVKLMEYGDDDDDDDDDDDKESFKRNSNRIAAPKPFWEA